MEHGMPIPTNSSQNMLLGYHYAQRQQAKLLAKERIEIQKRKDSAIAASDAARRAHSDASYTNRGQHRHGSRYENLGYSERQSDVASPMHDSAYYAIPGYVVADTIKIKFLFLFLPHKEKIRDAIGVQYWWSVLSLKESGWGPPSSVLKMVAHQQRSPFYFNSVYFSFWFRKQLSELLSLFYFYIFVLLVSQVIGRSVANIKPKGCAPM
jgi:hypothetical protein